MFHYVWNWKMSCNFGEKINPIKNEILSLPYFILSSDSIIKSEVASDAEKDYAVDYA